MTTTQTQKALREWRVLVKQDDCSPRVVSNGKTGATNDEMQKWVGKDVYLNAETMEKFYNNEGHSGTYVLEVLDGEYWHEVTHFSAETYHCPECGCEFEAVLSSEQIFDNFVPKHGCWGEDHEG